MQNSSDADVDVVVVVRWRRAHKAIGQAEAVVLLDEDRIPLIVRDCAKPSRSEGKKRREALAGEPALHNALSTATMAAESCASRKNRLMSKDSSRPCFK